MHTRHYVFDAGARYRLIDLPPVDAHRPTHPYRRFYVGAVAALIERMRGDDERAVIEAALRLVRFGERAVRQLIDCLTDPDLDLRRRSIWVLWRIEQPRAVDALMTALRYDPDAKVRRYSAWALGLMGGEDVVHALIEAFEDEDERVRWDAAVALGKIGEGAMEALRYALSYGAPVVRAGAANALGWINNHGAITSLVDALHDQSSEVRVRAAFSLNWIGSASALEGLTRARKDADEPGRRPAASGLGWMGSPRVVPTLLLALDDPSPRVTAAAADALAQIGDRRALMALHYVASLGAAHARLAALDALLRIGIDPHTQADPALIPVRPRLWRYRPGAIPNGRCNIILRRGVVHDTPRPTPRSPTAPAPAGMQSSHTGRSAPVRRASLRSAHLQPWRRRPAR